MPWPLDQVDLDASIVGVTPVDQGGLDEHRAGSVANYYSHGAVFNATMEVDPRDGSPIPELAAPEWIDAVTIRASVVPAPFHDGSILTAHDMVFTFDRKGGLAEYHQGGETSDHPGGFFTIADPQDPSLHELYLAQKAEQDPERRLEMITELFLEHARQAHFVYIVEAPDAVITREDVNWPKGGRAGFLWGGTAFAAQRRKA